LLKEDSHHDFCVWVGVIIENDMSKSFSQIWTRFHSKTSFADNRFPFLFSLRFNHIAPLTDSQKISQKVKLLHQAIYHSTFTAVNSSIETKTGPCLSKSQYCREVILFQT
jgi:hypothetical protein